MGASMVVVVVVVVVVAVLPEDNIRGRRHRLPRTRNCSRRRPTTVTAGR
jgi:hypothetical protein